MNRTTIAALLTTLLIGVGSAAGTRGFITGKVTNAQGQPLPGVTINASNTQFTHSDLITTTDAAGTYKLDVTALATTWHVAARQTLRYNGYTVNVALVPDQDTIIPGKLGGVRNFTFKPKPITPEDPYGSLGMVMLEETPGEFAIDFSKVQLTLTPVGTLADGSTGAGRTVRLTQTNSGWIAPNVMWGTYRVAATLGGKPLQLRRRAMGIHEYPWSASYSGGFYVDYYLPLPNMFLEAKLPGQ